MDAFDARAFQTAGNRLRTCLRSSSSGQAPGLPAALIRLRQSVEPLLQHLAASHPGRRIPPRAPQFAPRIAQLERSSKRPDATVAEALAKLQVVCRKLALSVGPGRAAPAAADVQECIEALGAICLFAERAARYVADGSTPTGGTQQQAFDGKLFVKGAQDTRAVSANDVTQGSLGNCYLMATLASVAHATPERIQKMIGKGPKPGSWWVTFQSAEGKPPRRVLVDNVFPARVTSKPMFAQVGDQQGDTRELWPMILEKAFVKLQGKKSYGEIRGDNMGGKGNAYSTLPLFTGRRSEVLTWRVGGLAARMMGWKTGANWKTVGGPGPLLAALRTALNAKRPVATCVPGHALSVLAVEGKNVIVQDPNWRWAGKLPDGTTATAESNRVQSWPINKFMGYFMCVMLG